MTSKYRVILGTWVLALAATIATQSAYADDLLFVSTGSATTGSGTPGSVAIGSGRDPLRRLGP